MAKKITPKGSCIKKLIGKGYPAKQAVAIAYSKARASKGKKR